METAAENGAQWWEFVGAFGAALGAIAAAVGAIAAWRAASASRATSRDALEALAVGIRPRLIIETGEEPREEGAPMRGSPTRLYACVVAVGEWPAADLEFIATFGDGRRVLDRLERLESYADPMGGQDEQGFAPLRDVTADWPPPMREADDWPERVTITVRFSDTRGIARYERMLVCGHSHRPADQGAGRHGSNIDRQSVLSTRCSAS